MTEKCTSVGKEINKCQMPVESRESVEKRKMKKRNKKNQRASREYVQYGSYRTGTFTSL